jgi:protein-disulfide isomerase
MRADRILSWALTAAAVVMAAVLVKREFFATAGPTARTQPPTPTAFPFHYDERWTELPAHGIRMGAPDAPIQLIELADLECPACRTFHLHTLREAKAAFGEAMAVTFVHFPLPYHRFAMPAARAAECAAEQGRFAEFLDVVFEKQDSLGLKPWESYASEAGVPNAATFVRCTHATGAIPRIDSGVAVGGRIQVTGTPTVFVNGWRFGRSPRSEELTRVIDDLLEGREPRP